MSGPEPVPGPGSEGTLVDALRRWREEGYTVDFSVVGGRIRCGACRESHDPAEAVIDGVARFEGASDPADESALFALRCRHCGARGTLVTTYGPLTPPEEAEVVRALTDGR